MTPVFFPKASCQMSKTGSFRQAGDQIAAPLQSLYQEAVRSTPDDMLALLTQIDGADAVYIKKADYTRA